jgi:periplasmic divalent cation tolerance protein
MDVPAETRSGSARLVMTTAPDRAAAEKIARELVHKGLAACVSLVPSVRSIYRWKGEVEEADEVLLLAKTEAARLRELERALAEIHPYEVPECLVLAPEHVEAKYLAWLVDGTRRSAPGEP